MVLFDDDDEELSEDDGYARIYCGPLMALPETESPRSPVRDMALIFEKKQPKSPVVCNMHEFLTDQRLDDIEFRKRRKEDEISMHQNAHASALALAQQRALEKMRNAKPTIRKRTTIRSPPRSVDESDDDPLVRSPRTPLYQDDLHQSFDTIEDEAERDGEKVFSEVEAAISNKNVPLLNIDTTPNLAYSQVVFVRNDVPRHEVDSKWKVLASVAFLAATLLFLSLNTSAHSSIDDSNVSAGDLPLGLVGSPWPIG